MCSLNFMLKTINTDKFIIFNGHCQSMDEVYCMFRGVPCLVDLENNTYELIGNPRRWISETRQDQFEMIVRANGSIPIGVGIKDIHKICSNHKNGNFEYSHMSVGYSANNPVFLPLASDIKTMLSIIESSDYEDHCFSFDHFDSVSDYCKYLKENYSFYKGLKFDEKTIREIKR